MNELTSESHEAVERTFDPVPRRTRRRSIVGLNGRLADGLSDRLSNRLSGRLGIRMNDRFKDWLNARVDGGRRGGHIGFGEPLEVTSSQVEKRLVIQHPEEIDCCGRRQTLDEGRSGSHCLRIT